MYCPKCHQANPADATNCVACGEDTDYVRDRLFIGREFIFVRVCRRVMKGVEWASTRVRPAL
jgi:hypothetical protein